MDDELDLIADLNAEDDDGQGCTSRSSPAR